MAAVVTHPLHSAAKWYRLMASNGITSTSDMTYDSAYLKGYEALAEVAHCPFRVSLYHVSTSPECGEALESTRPDMVRKQGIKLWADGSPWIGNRRPVVPLPLQRRGQPGPDSRSARRARRP